MSQPDLQTHEAKFHLQYEGLGLYWALSDLLFNQADGYVERTATIDGEDWEIDLLYTDSGIAPRATDDIDRDTVYEFDLRAYGEGERKVSVNFSPRWPKLRTPDGDDIDTAFQHLEPEDGVDAHVQGSNVALDDYPSLIARFILELAAEADFDWRQEIEPFAGRIYEVERYLRVNYDQSKKLIGDTGVMQRLMMVLAEEKGTRATLEIDNEGRVGKFRALQLHSADVAEVFPRHRAAWGRQLKAYLPKHPDSFEPEDALYHPKVGALFRKSLSEESVDWADRDRVQRELDETVLNALSWSGIPLDVGTWSGGSGGNGIFVPDDHYRVEPRPEHVPIYPDPTPELEAQQESILMWALGETTESDRDVLETLATDGGQDVEDLQAQTGWSRSTLYRVIDRLEGAIESQQGHFRFASRQFKREIEALKEQYESVRGHYLEKVERLTDYEIRSRSNSTFERFLAEYGAEFIGPEQSGDPEGRPVIRIGDVLTRLKSSQLPKLSDVVHEMIQAWRDDHREVDAIREAVLEADVTWKDGTLRTPVSAAI